MAGPELDGRWVSVLPPLLVSGPKPADAKGGLDDRESFTVQEAGGALLNSV